MWLCVGVIGCVCVALLAIGWRGRRIDSHPHCARCRFDLTGLPPTTAHCPECGLLLRSKRAIRIGRRRPLVAPIVLSIALLLGCGVWTGIRLIHQLREVGVLHYEPTWLLLRTVNDTTFAPSPIADELVTRLQEKRLSAAQVDRVALHALAVQCNPHALHTDRLAGCQFVEEAHFSHQLPKSRWASFAVNGLHLGVRARPVVHIGDVVPISIDVDGNEFTEATLIAFVSISDLSVDQTPATHYDGWGGWDGRRARLSYGFEGFPEHQVLDLDSSSSAKLAPGEHHVNGTLHVRIFDVQDVPEIFQQINKPPDPANRVAEFVRPFSAPFQAFDTAHMPRLMRSDPALKPKIEAAVKVTTVFQDVWKGKPLVRVFSEFVDPPLPLCFEIWIYPVGSQVPLLAPDGYVEIFPSGIQSVPDGDYGTLPPDIKAVDVVFRPNPYGFRDFVDDIYVWGDDIAFRNVPVRRRPSR